MPPKSSNQLLNTANNYKNLASSVAKIGGSESKNLAAHCMSKSAGYTLAASNAMKKGK